MNFVFKICDVGNTKEVNNPGTSSIFFSWLHLSTCADACTICIFRAAKIMTAWRLAPAVSAATSRAVAFQRATFCHLGPPEVLDFQQTLGHKRLRSRIHFSLSEVWIYRLTITQWAPPWSLPASKQRDWTCCFVPFANSVAANSLMWAACCWLVLWAFDLKWSVTAWIPMFYYPSLRIRILFKFSWHPKSVQENSLDSFMSDQTKSFLGSSNSTHIYHQIPSPIIARFTPHNPTNPSFRPPQVLSGRHLTSRRNVASLCRLPPAAVLERHQRWSVKAYESHCKALVFMQNHESHWS